MKERGKPPRVDNYPSLQGNQPGVAGKTIRALYSKDIQRLSEFPYQGWLKGRFFGLSVRVITLSLQRNQPGVAS